MTKFERRLDTARLAKAFEEHAAMKGLFGRWMPAGDGTDGGAFSVRKLRLAIRRDYLNFYLAGQSVARVELSARGVPIRVMVHEKYLENTATGHTYRQPSADPAAQVDIDLWITNAAAHCVAEKRFVDEVLSHNPGVIDIEMALPGKTALRMDIVALEQRADGWKLVFWEAKLASNAEARARDEPKVLEQRQNYLNWLAVPGQAESVVGAYRRTCKVLVQLHGMVPGIAPLGEGIRAVAEGAPLTVDPEIRLLVNARGDTRKFVENGHLAKLEARGLHVHMVKGPADLVLRTSACA